MTHARTTKTLGTKCVEALCGFRALGENGQQNGQNGCPNQVGDISALLESDKSPALARVQKWVGWTNTQGAAAGLMAVVPACTRHVWNIMVTMS